MRFFSTLKDQKHLTLRSALRNKASLKHFFSKLGVDLVFIHGSLARDKLKSLSDIDVAVLFKKNDYSLKTLRRIREKFSKMFGREDIDLAILNRASPLLWMQILHHGKIFYQRQKNILNKFRLQAIRRYLATNHLRKFFNEKMDQAILH